MPFRPVTYACLAAAIVFAFLRARSEQQARMNRTLEPRDSEDRERRPRLSPPKTRYTEEGEAHRERARRYRMLFFAFGLGALAAAWLGI